MYYISKRIEISYSHQLHLDYESKCNCRLRLLTFAAAGRYHFGRPEPADLRLPDHSATYDSREIRRYHRDAPTPPTSPPITSTT